MRSGRIWLSLLGLTILVLHVSGAQGFLRADGQKIVNDEGEVLLRGMGFGGWLLPEGYMLKMSSFANAPWEIRKKIEDLVGTANADQFFEAYRANFVTKADVDQIAGWGFNSIRLPMHYALLTPRDQPGVYLESGFAIIDSLLAWCEANQLYLILDLHGAPGGQNGEGISDYNPAEPSLWESAENQQRTVDLWRTIASRYATKQWIGGYDLLNEPAWDLGGGNVPLRTLYTQITGAIREADTNHILLIEGNWYATDFNGLTPPWDANMAYSFHKYWNTNDQNAISGYLSLRSTHNVPLWLGESGENSNTWFTDCVALLEANNVGWSWWTLKKVESTSGLMSVRKNAEYDYLLRYWNNQVSKPSVSYAMAGLTALANDFHFERCMINRDVPDALLRQPGNSLSVPFVIHDIPGTVWAVDYDLGRYNAAYRDLDYQNTGGGAAWNNGWVYRNDGVDIEECSDFPTNGYNVGWIETGEYLTFTVNVLRSANYRISARVAGGASGGKVLLKWDGNLLLDLVDVPVTGGWQNWGTIEFGETFLTAGTHLFSVHFFFGGFNVNSFEFTEIPTGIETDANTPSFFFLGQNYPNPFNPTTQIRFSVSTDGHVTLRIFNVLGQEVAKPIDHPLSAGWHSVVFDASPLPGGPYLYQLNADGRSMTRKLLLIK